MTVTVQRVQSPADFALCCAIRMEVFVGEQAVTLEEEMDGKDEEATHYIAFIDGKPAGTSRLRIFDGMAKFERVAVRAPYRKTGIGRALMEQMITDAKPHAKKGKLTAQVQAIPFYESVGFEVCSEEFLEARIPHKTMERKLA